MGGDARGTAVLRAESPFGWRWRQPPECSGSPATRKPAEELREVMFPAVPGSKQSGKERGKGQCGLAVPDRKRKEAEEGYTRRSTATRGGGARARSRARGLLERGEWCR